MKVAWILMAGGVLFFVGVWMGETNRMTLTGYQGIRSLHERFDRLERGIIHLSQSTPAPLLHLPAAESADGTNLDEAASPAETSPEGESSRNPHEIRAAQEKVNLTDRRGRTIEVRIVEVRPYNIAVQRSDGAILLIPDGILSDEDQAFVAYLRGGDKGEETASAQPQHDPSEFEDFDWSLFDF
jgi:hypothetical protein